MAVLKYQFPVVDEMIYLGGKLRALARKWERNIVQGKKKETEKKKCRGEEKN